MKKRNLTPVESSEGAVFLHSEASRRSSRQFATRIRYAARTILAGTCMIGGGFIGVAAGNSLAPTTVEAGALSASVNMEPTILPDGGTEIPTQVGSVVLPDTHKGAGITVSVSLDGDAATRTFEQSRDLETVARNIESELKPQIQSTVIETSGRSTLFHVAGNLAGALVYTGLMAGLEKVSSTPHSKISRKAMGIAAASLAFISSAPYNIQPALTRNADFATNIEYTGLLSEADESISDYKQYAARFNNPLNQLFAVRQITERLSEQPELRDVEVCLYLYADPHGGGYRLATELNDNDKDKDCVAVSVVLGDLVDWGQSFENSRDSVTRLPRLKGRVLVIKGNHDSRNTMNAVDNLQGITDLGKTGEVTIGGIRFVGITDPTFTPDTDGSKGARVEADEEAYQAGVRRGRDFVPDDKPMILFAHRENMIEGFFDGLDENDQVENSDELKVILVAAGHTHELEISPDFDGTDALYVNPGSISGSMLRLTDPKTGEQHPLSAAAVHIVDADSPQIGQVISLTEDFDGKNRSVGIYTPPTPQSSEEGGSATTTTPR